MNFFGHCVVSGWYRENASYALGSMLPDFATMSGTRLGEVNEPDVAAGVALHLRTDDVFHSAPQFLTLCGESRVALEAAEVGWGTARAVAHVGSELLLDGVLLERHSADPYLAAIERAQHLREHAHDETRAWFRDEGRGFEGLLGKLGAAGPPHAYRSPERVAEFLERALSRRKRLCFQPGDRERVSAVMETLLPRVAELATALMTHLREDAELQRLGATRT